MSFNQGLIEDLFRKVIGPFASTHISPLLFEPDSSEERVNLLTETFNRYPTLIPPFNALIKSLHAESAEAVLEEKIRFYTTKHTRNWLIVNLMNQTLKVKDLQLDLDSGRLPGKPADLIKFATQSRIAFGEESRYKDIAFIGGLFFDFLFYLQRSNFVKLDGAKFDESINQAFTKALEQGQLVVKLSKYKPKLSLERLSLLTVFLRQLSQVCLYVLAPTKAPEFYKKLDTMKLTETIRLALELKTFGLHTGVVGCYLAQALPPLNEAGEAMSVWGAPYLSWVHSHREIHDLAGMGMLGQGIKEYLSGSDFSGGGAVGKAIPELSNLDVVITSEVKNEIKI